MRRKLLIIIIVFIAIWASSCNYAIGAPEKSDILDVDNNVNTEIDGDNDKTESFENNDDMKTNGNDGDKLELGDINVHDLLFKQLEEAIAILGPNHSEPFSHLGAPTIYYEGSFYISYFMDVESLGQGLRIIPEADVVAVGIFQELDVYKGISVGKSLDEINSNPDLLNQLKPSVNEMDDILRALGIYMYEDSYILMFATFNENMVCDSIVIKKRSDDYDNDIQDILL